MPKVAKSLVVEPGLGLLRLTNWLAGRWSSVCVCWVGGGAGRLALPTHGSASLSGGVCLGGWIDVYFILSLYSVHYHSFVGNNGKIACCITIRRLIGLS